MDHSTSSLLVPSVTNLDLGYVPQAGRQHEVFALANPGTEPVEIATIDSSCECLQVHLADAVVEAGQQVLAMASLDLSSESKFLGGLAIQVTGRTLSGKPAFSMVINVMVRPRDEFPAREQFR